MNGIEEGVSPWTKKRRKYRRCIGRRKRRVGECKRRPGGGGVQAPSRNPYGRRRTTRSRVRRPSTPVDISECGVDGPSEEEVRCGIYVYFWKVLKFPPESTWDGEGGLIAHTARLFKCHDSTVRLVFYGILGCYKLGMKYDAKRRYSTDAVSGDSSRRDADPVSCP